jgi:hypothetical protein
MTATGAVKGKRVRVIVMAVVIVAVTVMTSRYVVPIARHRSQNVALGREWAGHLQQHPTFSGAESFGRADVAFTYAGPTDENLSRLRELYDLDSIAGQGSETERLINCPQRSLFNQAAQPGRVFFELIPDGYREALLREPAITDSGKIIVYTTDEDLFWQQPS